MHNKFLVQLDAQGDPTTVLCGLGVERSTPRLPPDNPDTTDSKAISLSPSKFGLPRAIHTPLTKTDSEFTIASDQTDTRSYSCDTCLCLQIAPLWPVATIAFATWKGIGDRLIPVAASDSREWNASLRAHGCEAVPSRPRLV